MDTQKALAEWSDADVRSLIERAGESNIALLSKRWFEQEAELGELRARRKALANDKVIVAMIDTHIAENTQTASDYAKSIAATKATSPLDMVCKLVVAERAFNYTGINPPEPRLTASAVQDLLDYIKTNQTTG